jgi:hypothetical protein
MAAVVMLAGVIVFAVALLVLDRLGQRQERRERLKP